MKKIDTIKMRSIEAGKGSRFSITGWKTNDSEELWNDNDYFGLDFGFKGFGNLIVAFKYIANYIFFDGIAFQPDDGQNQGLSFFFSFDKFFNRD